MFRKSFLAGILNLALLLFLAGGSTQSQLLLPMAVVEATQNSGEDGLPQEVTALPGANADWWHAVQEGIRQSEYDITWQERTYLADLAAAYQAPNRAHNLRTYFTSQGIRVIPRLFEGDRPPWEWDLSLSGYGSPVGIGAVAMPVLSVQGNRIEYRRGALTEWYVNDEHGLKQGFTLHTPPPQAEGALVLTLTWSGNLQPAMSADEQAIDWTTPGGVCVLHYSDLVVTDAAGRTLPAHFELLSSWEGEGSGRIKIVIAATGAAYPITVDPLVTSPSWTAESDQENALFGYSVGTAGDVNGDGYSDVIVGAPNYDGGQAGEGRAYVYLGSAAGLSAAPAWTAESDLAGAEFGYSVGMAGDVNGDGYSDAIVGAPHYGNDQTDEGRAYVYLGSAAGLSTTQAWTAEGDQAGAEFGYSVGTAGDVNGDGYSDVIVGAPNYDGGQADEGRAYVYLGSAAGLSAAPAWTAESDLAGAEFGYSVGTAGDVNGDGYSDVIVGAPYYDNDQTDEGRAYVYLGSAAGLSATQAWTAEGGQDGALLGHSGRTAGDVNGDGYSDVIVGAPGYDNPQMDEGRAYVYLGSAVGPSATPAWTAESNCGLAGFGWSVGMAGDVNGDGYSDVIIGAYRYSNVQSYEGGAFVYHGSAAGLSATPAWTAESNQDGALLGQSVGTAGDVNGDGYSDVIVGAPNYDGGQTDEGRAYVYLGSAAVLSAAPAWAAEGGRVDAYFGYSVGTAGDVNGDGYSDVIVGAPLYDNGQADAGRAYVYHGSATGLSATPAWTAEGDQAGAEFGSSVGTAGDVNGDGYSDVIVGAPFYDAPQMDEGRAYVYLGSANGLLSAPIWMTEGDQDIAYFGASVGTAGDVNGDGYSDVIVGAPVYTNGQLHEGRAFVYHGLAAGLSLTANWMAESNQSVAIFGCSVATAGDVNGDGYSDVIVGAHGYDNGQVDEGRAYVYLGSAAGLSSIPAWMVESDQASALFGVSVGTAGDVNGDGYSDVIVGAYWYDNGQVDEGRAYVYHGSATGLSATANWTAESDQASAEFGISVGTAGDVNGDGYSDVIVGGSYNKVLVYHGSAAGLSDTPAWTTGSHVDYTWFGRSVGTAGDVNGDGYSDVIVGEPRYYYSSDEYCEGRASVYYGNESDGLHLLPRQMRTDGSTSIAYQGMSDARTAFQLRLIGRMPIGREYVRLQWQVAPLGTPITANSVISGVSTAWTDVLTTGVEISQTVSGLGPGMPYHWRVRLLYRPGNVMGQSAGRWVHIPWNGWNEADLRTLGQPPAADAGPDRTVSTNTLVTLDGSRSYDPDGNYPLSYFWTQTGGPPVTLSDPRVVSPTFTAPGNPTVLTFTLVVTDSQGLPDRTPDEVVITVTNPPVADAGPDQTVRTNATVILDGRESYDPDGDYPLSYLWTQTGIQAVSLSDPHAVTPTFTAPWHPAVLIFTLVVTDSLGLPDPTPDTVVITVTNPPAADAGPDQTVRTNATVTLDGSGSSDPDGDYPLSYFWTQTGGPPVTLSDPRVVTPTFTAPGNPTVLTFTLTVTDSLGLPDPTPDEVVITVRRYYFIYLPLVLRGH